MNCLADVQEAYRAGKRLKYLFFWGHTPKRPDVVDKACFSQWYPAPFEIDGISYATAEHYMMAGKARLFGDDEQLANVLAAKHPKQAKAYGRAVKNFDKLVWDAHGFDLVVAGNLAKFSQNLPLKEFLLKTYDHVLVEASPYDKIWGIGMKQDHRDIENPLLWQGDNLLGFALMVARQQLGEF